MSTIQMALIAGVFGLLASGPSAPSGRLPSGEPVDLVETAASAGSFQTLVTALKAAGLDTTLKGPGPFTVFAPTDEAFAKLPEGTVESLLEPENREKLIAILTYHVVPGRLMAGDVTSRSSLETVQGDGLTVHTEDGRVMVGEARVLKTDVAATNGVIHIIDTVLLPR